MGKHDPILSFVSFFVSPSVLFGVFIVIGIYIFMKKNFGNLSANVALPLIVLIVFCYNIAILTALTTLLPDCRFQYSQLIGAIYAIIVLILMIKGASKKKIKSTLVGSILEKSSGIAHGLEVQIFNLPFKRHKSNGRRFLYENQSSQLLEFLEEKITKESYEKIMQKRYFETKVETESVPPYTLKITIPDKYKYEDSEAFLSDVLDAIADLYNRNKIKV